MVVCRARKEWPAYFTLSINELPNQLGENGERTVALPPSLTSMITDKFLFDQESDDDKKSVGSIGSDEAVLFVNPCDYTLETDEHENDGREKSAFDPDVIEEDSGLLGKDKQAGSRDELYR